MTTRLHGLDYIRLVSFFAIATFHVSLIHYYTSTIAIADKSIVIKAAEQISRVLSFSGFTICFLSSLLTAFSGSSLWKRVRLFAFLFVGWAAFSALMSTPEDTWLVWDIYPLIFVGILLCSMMQIFSEKMLRVAGILGFCMLWIPFWDFRAFVHLPATLQTSFGFSDCATDIVEWPVFPWLGLVFFGYWVGNEARNRWQSQRNFFALSTKEGAFWTAALAISTIEFGNFYGIKLGSAFACEAYRQPPIIWWSHFLWPLFLIRLSFDPRVQSWLSRLRVSRFVSGLAINRKFWLAYFINYLFCYVLSMLVTWSDVEKTEWNTTVIAFIAVFLVPMTEGLTQAIIWSARNIADFRKAAPIPVAAEAEAVELNPVRSQHGASLLAVMIASAVIGGMVAGVTLMVKARTDQRMLRNAINGKEYAFELLRQSASSPDALRVSATKSANRMLRQCALGIGSAHGCSNTNSARAHTLTLYVPYAGKTAPVAVTATGPSAVNAHYDMRGLRTACKPSDTCLYWATAQWWAQCPNNAPSCKQATRIYVIPQLIPFSGSKKQGHVMNTVALAPVPRADQIAQEKADIAAGKPMKYAVSVMTSDITSTQMQQCPQGSFMSGTSADGTLKCSCAHGYLQDGNDAATGWPVCKAMARCIKPKILAGIKKDGTPDCYDPKGTSFACERFTIGSNGTVSCKPGSRMREVSVTEECKVLKDKDKKEYVDCGSMQIQCCAPN